ESAIKHRYCAKFPEKVIIRNHKGQETAMSRIDHGKIDHLCKKHKKEGWKKGKLWINGHRFRYRMADLLDWLVDNEIITKWERKMCEYHKEQRDYLSHPTFSPIYPNGPARNTLKEVAYLINKMFSSLKTT
ncbi:MAG: hypothetical protein IIA83_10625, partial [Thaumarchaeota archaeon]|nr:hypothetical protein [Nitrososphaerota archaeon]